MNMLASAHMTLLRSLQGSWKAPDALWIAMEYCAGGSVSDLMRAADAPLPEPLIAFVTRHTLAGLAYLHSVGKVQPHPRTAACAWRRRPACLRPRRR